MSGVRRRLPGSPPDIALRAGLATALASNAVAAGIGFVQSVVVVRSLGFADYGVYGVLGSIAAICANAVDLRLGDATMRRFFEVDLSTCPRAPAGASAPLAVLLAGGIAQVALAALLAAAILLAALPILEAFPAARLPGLVLVAFAVSEALAYSGRYLLFTMRFARDPRMLAACEVSAALLRGLVVCAAVWLRPSLSGLISGLLLAGAATWTLNGVAFARVWLVRLGLRASAAEVLGELRVLRVRRRDLFALNSINYQNLLHRGADVLAVGLLGGEREAGLYRLARSLSDALYVFYDAAAKTLQPLLMQLLAAAEGARLHELAHRVLRLAALGTAVLLLVELAFLPELLRLLYGASSLPAAPAILLLSAAAFFVFGLNLWTWPLIVHAGAVRTFAATGFVAVLLGQYGIGLTGALLGSGGATWFAAGYLASEALLWAAFGPRAAALLDAVGVRESKPAQGRDRAAAAPVAAALDGEGEAGLLFHASRGRGR